jgi:hypothetical protein
VTPSGSWDVALNKQAAQVLAAIRKIGDDKLHDELVRFLRALALEVRAALKAGRRPAGVPALDGGYSVDVRQEEVLVYYRADAPGQPIVVTDILWLGG